MNTIDTINAFRNVFEEVKYENIKKDFEDFKKAVLHNIKEIENSLIDRFDKKGRPILPNSILLFDDGKKFKVSFNPKILRYILHNISDEHEYFEMSYLNFDNKVLLDAVILS